MIRTDSSSGCSSQCDINNTSNKNQSVLLQFNDDSDSNCNYNYNCNSNQKKKYINIARLEHEIVQDISNDSKYYAEDEMKKRAVQTSKDYDEFRNFVACSQLKPVQSGDMGQLFVGRRNDNYNYYNRNNNDSESGSGSYTSAALVQSKRCSVQLNNEKRLAALLNDIDGASNGRKSAAATSSSNGYKNKHGTQEDETALESLTVTATATPKIAPSNDTAYEYVLNLKTKTEKSIKKETASKRKKKNKKAQSSPSDNRNRQPKKSHDGQTKSFSCGRIKSTCTLHGPRNAMEFEKEWKSYCQQSSFDDILQYLTLSSNEDDAIEEFKNKKPSPPPPSSSSSPFASTTLSAVDTTITYNNPSHQTSSFSRSPFPSLRIPTKLRLEPEQVSRSVCKVEMTSNIMGQIIQTLQYLLSHYFRKTNNCNDTVADGRNGKISEGNLNTNCNGNTLQFVYRWMDALTKCGRFHLNIEFLNEEQKKCINFIFGVLEQEITKSEREFLLCWEADDIVRLKSLYVCS